MTRKRFQKLVLAEIGSKYWYEIKKIRCWDYQKLYNEWVDALNKE